MHNKSYWMLFLVIYITLFSYLDFRAFSNANITWSYDVAFYINSIYNTYNGNFLISTIPGQDTFMEYHGHGPFLAFLSIIIPFVKLNWYFFSLFKISLIAMGVIPIYLISKSKFKNEKFAIIFSIAYLFYPMVIIIVLSDFRAINFLITPILFLYYFLLKKKYFLAYAFSFISLLIREEAIYLVSAIFLYFSISLLKKQKWKKLIKLNLPVFAQLLLLMSVVYPIFKYDILLRSSEYSVIQLSLHNLSGVNAILIFFTLFLPFFFLGIKSYIHLLNIPFFIEYLLLGVPFTFHADVLHYYSMIIPLTFIGIIDAFSRIKNKFIKKNLALIILLSYLFTFIILTQTDVSYMFSKERYKVNNIESDVHHIKGLIDESALAVDGSIVHLFSLRPEVYIVPSYWEGEYDFTTLQKSKYIILPKDEEFVNIRLLNINLEDFNKLLDKSKKEFNTIYEGDVFILFEN